MALKYFKPVTPGQRGLILVDKSKLYKGKPLKSLLTKHSSSGGRNNAGRMTMRGIGGGAKRRYRVIDFKRNKDNIVATVLRIEYDPNRSAFIALLKYEDNTHTYIIAIKNMKAGDTVVSGEKVEIKAGNAMQLRNIPIGTRVHNVELRPGKGGQLARSAGLSLQIMGRDQSYTLVRLKSGEVRLIHECCRATIGEISNADHQNEVLAKAGRNRWRGIRPTVRGVAKNPVDHPHGGGEGKTSGGRHPVTPWGVSTKGHRTRKNTRSDKFIIRRRHRK